MDEVDSEEVDLWAVDGGHLVGRSLDQAPVLTRTWFDTGADDDAGLERSVRAEGWQGELARAGFPVGQPEPSPEGPHVVVGSADDRDALGADVVTHRREAARACRGAMLRQEVFALDAPTANATDHEVRRRLTPYRVTQRSSMAILEQPATESHPPVYVTTEAETVTWDYERDPDDPRVRHTLSTVVDALGHVVESASIAYARAQADDAGLPASVRDTRGRPQITYTTTTYTDERTGAALHRRPVAAATSAFELFGIPAVGLLFRRGDFVGDGFRVLRDSAELPAHEIGTPAPGGPAHRLIARHDTAFLDDALAAPLALASQGASGLAYESYELALTAALVTAVFGGRATDALLTEAGYTLREGGWWVPSGRWRYLDPGETAADALVRFVVPLAHIDALGAVTDLTWQTDSLLRAATTDAADNHVSAEYDLRTLAPRRVVDANGNVTEVLLDALGRVKAAAMLGKGAGADDLVGLSAEATPADDAHAAALVAATQPSDLLAHASALLARASVRHVYDLGDPFDPSGARPPAAVTVKREQYAAVDEHSPVQVLVEYTDGTGRVQQAKMQAEPGPASDVAIGPDGSVTVTTVDTSGLAPPQLRWVGSGRRVLNNKGNVIKEYEPFFSTTHRFEEAAELVEVGVVRTYRYDPLDRVVRVDQPDGTFSRVAPAGWKTVEWDRNDTSKDSVWYSRRINREIDAELIAAGKDPVREQAAATRAGDHAGTPTTRLFDPLGRTVLDERDDGTVVPVRTTYVLGPLGERRSVTDPRGHVTVSYRHDLRGHVVSFATADGGRRWMLDRVDGEPLRLWDERARRFEFEYNDPLHRVTAKRVVGGDDPQPLDHVYEQLEYGETVAGARDRNLRTRVAVHRDTAGQVVNDSFDLHGNLVRLVRRFATDYRRVPSWNVPDPSDLLDAESFVTEQTFDGLGRVHSTTTADGSVAVQRYNAANLLRSVGVTADGQDTEILRRIEYDVRGERQRIELGNGVVASYTYDRETNRLLRLRSTLNGTVLQDLHYTYDAVGNITHVVDDCVPTVWFANAMVTGERTYRYDPLYQLVAATGREHAGQTSFGPTDNTHDASFAKRYDPLDTLAWRNYTDTYHYDAGGNLDSWAHLAAGNDWTRTFAYASDSNRLLSTTVGQTTYPYGDDTAHGLVTSMPHLPLMRWGIRDELVASATQVVGNGTPETTWYVYDSAGRRVRKVTDSAAAPGADPQRRVERFYLGLLEIEREHTADPHTRTTLHVRDELATIAMIETDEPAIGALTRVVRYQCPDHLGSTSLETDETGRTISYEEFHPFGTSAYLAVDRSTTAAAKRYRYTGVERDDETGLQFHGARYYAPWLGRWLSPDHHADQLAGNRFAYVKNNPVVNRDRNGQFEEPVHGAATYRLALAAGFNQADAAKIAIATAGMDHDPATTPGDDMLTRGVQVLLGRTREFHFPTQQQALSRVEGDIRSGVKDLEQFGRHLHSLEDVGFANAPGPHTRSAQHGLQSTLAAGTFGIWAGGIALSIGAMALFAVSNTGTTSGKVGFGIAVVLVGLAVVAGAVSLWLAGVAGRAEGLGHPSYETETQLRSNYDNHLADQAFQDPKANKKELWGIYQELRKAADAHYGHRRAHNDAAARRIIRDVVKAADETAINNFLNASPVDARGRKVKESYADVVRAAGRWQDTQIDVSIGVKEHSFTYRR